MPPAYDEVDESPLFGPAERRRYSQDLTYQTADYVDLLRTYSGHRALPPDTRRRLLDCIAALINDRYGGRITKRYLYELRIARRT